jgi:hypothetical protein
MKAIRFSAASGAVGIAVGLSINLLWYLFEHSVPLSYHSRMLKATLLLFPPAIATIAISGATYWNVDHLVLIAFNGVFYAILGFVLWLGLYNNRAYFALVALIYLSVTLPLVLLR